MKTNSKYTQIFVKVASAESNVFSHLVELSGLDPKVDFQDAPLRSVDLEGSDLSLFNFDRADLRGASWKGVLGEPFSCIFCLRGGGDDSVSGADFQHIAEVCYSKESWGERFIAFKTLVDNWGENIDTANVLLKVLNDDRGTYLRHCAFLYFCASYFKDDNVKNRSLEMAKAGRSQINIFRIKFLKKAVADYFKYLESVKMVKRYPGDIDAALFRKVQSAMVSVEERVSDARFL